MKDGVDNLARLFASEDVPKPEGRDEENHKDAIYRYRGRLKEVLDGLNGQFPISEDWRGSTPVTIAVDLIGRNVTLTEAKEGDGADILQRLHLLQYSNTGLPYASGFHNAASLFLDPLRLVGYDNTQRIYLSNGQNWSVSDIPVRSQRKVVVSGRLVPDPVNALELWLDKAEGRIAEDIVGLEGDKLVSRKFFYIGPDVGLSLVGYGDAMLKAAQYEQDRTREPEFLELAKRSYRTSGLRDTLYVGNRLLDIGEIPSKAYFLVPAHLVTPELRKQLETD